MGDRHRGKCWVKRESTSRPGHYYYFNTKTGQKSWENEGTPVSPSRKLSENLQSPLRLSKSSGIRKSSKTPAQDRLNNLKLQLTSDQLKTALTDSFSTRDINRNPNKLNFGKNVWDRPYDKLKKLNQGNGEQEKLRTIKPQLLINKPQPGTTVEGNNNVAARLISSQPLLIKTEKEKVLKSTLQLETEKKNGPRSTVANRLEHLPSNTFKRKFEDCPQISSNKILKLSAPPVRNIEKIVPKQKFTAPAFKFTQMTVPAVPVSVKSNSANDRLKNLRNWLTTQTHSLANKLFNGTRSETATTASCSLNETSNIQKTEDIRPNETLNPNDVVTPMNLDISDDTINIEIQTMRCAQTEENSTTLAEYYDLVKENLLKQLSESSSANLIINANYLHIVIDTNVFLQNLKFLDDLTLQSFSDKERVVLIVPYVVIQELDRLKQNKNNPISTLAVRAVKYLNGKLVDRSESLKGQSAIESRRKLIPIESADDNIINCCLQIKKNCSRLLLLSNDVNLRNKALINNIKTCTKSDLESENLHKCKFS